MRGVVLLLVAGCGRLGFDEGGPSPDAAPAVPDICNPRVIGDLALSGESAIKVRAVALSTGHAVAIETDTANTYVARLDAAGDVVSTHLPFAGGYTLHGISQVADRPFVYVFTSGAGYIKLLVPDWNSYDTGPSGDELSMDPQQALLPNNTAAIYGVFGGGVLGIHTIDATNTTMGDADYAPPASFASFGSTSSGVRVVVENAGTCETFSISPAGITGPRHSFAPCFEPRLATVGELGTVLYRTAIDGPFAIHEIPADPTLPGDTITLERGTNPRITRIDDAVWVGYLRETGEARLIRRSAEATTMRDFSPIATSFELLPSGAFWVTSTGELHGGLPCL